MYLRPDDQNEGKRLVWENIILVQGDSPSLALDKAKKAGLEDQEYCSEGLTVDRKPARMVFLGVRKLIECRTVGDIEDKPADGSEVSFSEFLVENDEDLRKLAKGEAVKVIYQNGHGDEEIGSRKGGREEKGSRKEKKTRRKRGTED